MTVCVCVFVFVCYAGAEDGGEEAITVAQGVQNSQDQKQRVHDQRARCSEHGCVHAGKCKVCGCFLNMMLLVNEVVVFPCSILILHSASTSLREWRMF